MFLRTNFVMKILTFLLKLFLDDSDDNGSYQKLRRFYFRYINGIFVKIYRIIKGDLFWVKVNKKFNTEMLGDRYGGYKVCLDGMNSNSIVYSCGIGENITFDKCLMERFNCNIYAFDPTEMAAKFIQESDINESKFFFNRVGIAGCSGKIILYGNEKTYTCDGSSSIFASKNGNNISETVVEAKSISDIMKENNHDVIDILKMDIEGSEYEVIPDVVNNCRVKQMTLEFHSRLIDIKPRYANAKILKMLKKAGWVCIYNYIAKNGQESTFINLKEWKC